MRTPVKINDNFWLGLAAIGLLFLSHYFFSSLGFNPSDEGFILAYARRVIFGEIPHVDFISIRPVLSAYLHAPVVYFSGESTFILSRLFVWGQFIFIAWGWVVILLRIIPGRFILREKLLLLLIIFIFNVHTFPILAWHTVDGIFLLTAGMLLLQEKSDNRWKLFSGYFLVGASVLAKQNFLPAAILIPFFLGDEKKLTSWVTIFIPLILYLLFMIITGGLGEFFNQVFSETSLIQAGILSYLTELSFFAGVGLAAFPFLIRYFLKKDILFRFNSFLFPFLILISSIILLSNKYTVTYSFFICGLFIGYWLFTFKRKEEMFRWGGVIAIIAWSASVSVGYNTPALFTGVMLGYIFLLVKTDSPEGKRIRVTHLVFPVLLLVFYYVRTNHIYRDQLADNLTYDLGNVFPGANGIRTNKLTWKKVNELDSLIHLFPGKKIAILPDFAAYWVASKQENPLDMDWVAGIEIQNEGIRNRLIGNMESGKPLIVFVQKEKARTFQIIDSVEKVDNPLADYVLENGNILVTTPGYSVVELGPESGAGDGGL